MPVRIPFDNTYARLPERFYVRLDPKPVAAPWLVRVNAARLTRGKDLGGCEEILERFGSSLLGGELRIRQVSVSGNRARVEANLRLPETKGAEARTIQLELDEQGDWRVSEPG